MAGCCVMVNKHPNLEQRHTHDVHSMGVIEVALVTSVASLAAIRAVVTFVASAVVAVS
jgi:hypothetical protein